MAKALTRAQAGPPAKAFVAGPLTVNFTLEVWKENAIYVAYAPELDVSSCAASLAQAKARLREAVSLFLEEAVRLGTLEEVLSEAGYERQGNTYRPHRLLTRQKVRLAPPVTS